MLLALLLAAFSSDLGGSGDKGWTEERGRGDASDETRGERMERVRDSRLTWVVGVDVSGLDGDETGGVGGSGTETLSKEFRHDFDESRVKSRVSKQLLIKSNQDRTK